MTNLVTSIPYFSNVHTLPRRLVLSFTQGTDYHLKCFGGMGNELIIGHPIDSGMGLSITIDKLRVFINKTLSTQSLINQPLIKRVGLSIVIDNGKFGQGMRSCKCTNHKLYAGGCQ